MENEKMEGLLSDLVEMLKSSIHDMRPYLSYMKDNPNSFLKEKILLTAALRKNVDAFYPVGSPYLGKIEVERLSKL